MALFDWSGFRDVARGQYQEEFENSKSLQDEVKVFNERFPKALEPLHELIEKINAASGSGGELGEFSNGTVAGDTYEEQAWSYFLGKGFEKKCIAGIMGNFEQESGIDPTTIQGGGKGPGTGLIQWGDSMDGGRWNALEKWAQEQGRDQWDMVTQLDYLWIEMTNGSHDTYWHRAGQKVGHDLSGSGEAPVKKFGAIDHIEDSMKIFELTIERAGHKAYGTRLGYANNFYEKYKDWDPSMSSGGDGSFSVPHKTDYTVTSEYGYRTHPIDGNRKLHAGIDVSTGKNTPIYPIANGSVVVNKSHSGWGNYLVVDHGVIKDKQMFSLYAHLVNKASAGVGQSVTTDTEIGREGTTGSSTAIHLHLEVSEMSPGSSWSSGSTVDPRNHITFS